MTVDDRTGKRVKVSNPKHANFRQFGKIVRLDRGNVWVMLDTGAAICTRFGSLSFVK